MLKFKELVRTKEYWMELIQNNLYAQVKHYMEIKGINQSQLAEQLGVSKSYISQVLNGNFNYTLSKLIELSLAIGVAPDLEFKSFEEYLKNEEGKISSGQIQLSRKPFVVVKGAGKAVIPTFHSHFSMSVPVEPVLFDLTEKTEYA